MCRPGQVFSQLQLLDAAWDLGYEHHSNVVEVYIRYLRNRIDRPFGLCSLETVRGVGYRLRADGGTPASGSPDLQPGRHPSRSARSAQAEPP